MYLRLACLALRSSPRLPSGMNPGIGRENDELSFDSESLVLKFAGETEGTVRTSHTRLPDNLKAAFPRFGLGK